MSLLRAPPDRPTREGESESNSVSALHGPQSMPCAEEQLLYVM